MSPNYRAKKVNKKQRRCEAIIRSECAIESSEEPTQIVGVLNAGLSTGLTEERVLDAAQQHGEVTQLVMVPSKSYCFLVCASVSDAAYIVAAMHNVSQIGQNGAVVFLAYFKQLPKTSDDVWQKAHPPGLILLPEFVSPVEEEQLLAAIHAADAAAEDGDALKHRRVKHFGYEFMYGSNNVDPSRPLARGIPAACGDLWPRLRVALQAHNAPLHWDAPDQLTVNEYEPGQGIPPHVDTHSAFLEPILSLSLQSDVVMDFRRGPERTPVVLPRRSLLVMAGEARYDWTHGITPRVYDVVPTPSGALTTRMRSRRTSLTFRRLRRAPCYCSFPTLCNSRLEQSAGAPPAISQDEAIELEAQNVHSVYDRIANHFSETRHTPWPQVAAFLDSFAPGSVLVDVGCGNGKYLQCNTSTLTLGCDRSDGLLAVCTTNKHSVFRCDCLAVPVRSQSVDGCISIAVIHHLATPERRLAAVREMARLLRPGGRALIYVWARNQRADAKQSSYLRQNKAVTRQKTTEQQQRQLQMLELQQQQQEASLHAVNLPVHTNRTDFRQQDVLVPWKLKGASEQAGPQQAATFLRYYHVFEEHELEQLVAQVAEVELTRSYYDQGNHCVVFRRK